jgi:hypothetical protein
MRSFWRDWVVSYDVGQQHMLGQEAIQGGRQWASRAQTWYRNRYQGLLSRAKGVSASVTDSPQSWGWGAVAVTLAVLLLLNLGKVRRYWWMKKLLAQPGNLPREAAALWYERMTMAVGKKGWKKLPAQTAREFLESIGDLPMKEKVAEFTQHYEGARFGDLAKDAERLPELYDKIGAVGREF